ncbi:MAG TPA: homocysteine S-methyltransferase family protein [Mycobacteriales bacterium]|nr:homocysteine S-methyltransferase family protein [Mycobacteriales bacterium]
MPSYRQQLPQLDADVFLTDGGIETTLIFDDGFELPDFAAFPLLDDAAGRTALVRYFEPYLDIARRDGVGIVLETPTWRASADWGTRLGYSPTDLVQVNRDAVELLLELRQRYEAPATPVVISGCIGPRGDGYRVMATMTPAEAQAYHAEQIRTFADTEVDLVTTITIPYVEEAVGVTEAARAAGLPVVVSFVVETDGRLPSGQHLGDAIEAVDAATSSYPVYYMLTCAHPTHFSQLFDRVPTWAARVGGVRANASTLSHAELDAAEELDAGDPVDLAARCRELHERLPALRVLGGCCGTSSLHIDAMSRALAGA